jgi:hypothetical protein
MQLLNLPHRVIDYLCPVNGICDIYEWKTGERLPEELIFYSRLGFQMISQKKANPPKMIFLSTSSIGRRQYEFFNSIIGFHIYSSEGKAFTTTLSEIKELIDNKIPVILFGLDMFYLPYHDKFYHMLHIPGHIILMVGYDDKAVYVHDNSKEGIQTVPYEDLMSAWAKNYIGISKKNAYFGIDLTNNQLNVKEILKTAYQSMADDFINSPLSFSGMRGIDRFLKELSSWKDIYDKPVLESIYKNFIYFTGSTLPGFPPELEISNQGIFNPHKGGRDKLSASLINYQEKYGGSNWSKAALSFEKSGDIIEGIVHEMVQDILEENYKDTDKYIPLFEQFKQAELTAYITLSDK